MQKLYTTQQVAEYLQVTIQSVYNYIKRGKLKTIKFSGSTRVKESDLQRFIENK